ncbi:MAG: glycosyltransferase family 2 protein, partial [Spirochaetales bacterium]|nr:glycosyltransferase family 2 protein [Spirochaetales bacterium]
MQNRFKFKLSVVVPSYNEEQNVLVLAERLTAVVNAVGIKNYQVIFVNDGSSDDTLKNLQLLHEQDKHIEYISFSRNFGHQCALRAGLDYADGDCVVSMDADMQHPPELIPDMIAKWQEGYDIVYTLREESKKLSLFKRWTSKSFYGVINKLSNIKIQP